MRHDFSAFSDHDFELFVAELLHAEEGRRYEVFTRGPDEGIDLRYHPSSRKLPDVVQCKHKLAGTYSQLKSDMREELANLRAMKPRPYRYVLFTTLPLTPNRKRELVALLSPFVKSTGDIVGLDEVSTLVSRHPTVEKNNPKLWLRSGTQLKRILNAATYERSRQLLTEINSQLPRYVKTNALGEAAAKMNEHRVLLVSGPPGIGKSTLAKILLLDAAANGFEPIEISTDINEANQVIDRDKKQIFYYDDFLGTTFIHDHLEKNEELRLTRFIRDVEQSPNTKFVMTTREYILLQAVELYEEFARAGLDKRRYLLELDGYSRLDKARILYNHVWVSDQLNSQARNLLATDRGYLGIVNHPYFNPRVIEYITGLASRTLSDQDNSDFLEFARNALEDPSLVWRQAFENQLTPAERAIVVVAATLPARFDLPTLEHGVHAYGSAMAEPLNGSQIHSAIKSVGESFLKSMQIGRVATFELVNPSLVDFVARWLADRTPEREATIAGSIAFEQLKWLQNYALIDASRHPSESSLEKFEEAVLRLWDVAPLKMAVTVEGQTQLSWYQPNRNLIERLRFAISHSKRYVVSQKMQSEIAVRTDAVIAGWTERKSFDFDGSRMLLDELIEVQGVGQRALEAFKEFAYSAYWPRDWRVAMDFAEVHSELYSDEELELLQTDFDLAFNRTIEEADDADSTSDLEDFYDIAENHHREIDEIAYIEALSAVEEGIARREPDWDDDDRYDRDFSSADSGSLEELDALFGRLAD